MPINETTTEELLKEQVDSCLQLLRKLDTLEWNDNERTSSATRLFMSALLDLYLTIQREPALKEVAIYQDFLEPSAVLVARVQDYIINYEMSVENLFHIDPDYDPWETVCWRRSAFQAFLEVYQFTQKTKLKEYLNLSNEDFNPEDIDYMIEGYIMRDGGTVDEDEIPVGIPRSHWWWWGEKTEAA
jgi:hypothetical protein